VFYHRARYYDPQARRFISEDPIGLNGGINLYAYVGNNPINMVDPFGLDPYAGYANGVINGSDIGVFRDRAIQGAGKNVFGFNSPNSLISALLAAKDITRLDLHGHGVTGLFYTGNLEARIQPGDWDLLARLIASGKIDMEKGATIRLFACHQDTNAKYLSQRLSDLGRKDITVIGSSGSVYPNSTETRAYSSGGAFISYQNGIMIKQEKFIPYKP
jgi:uncharacterized protein RhaS with RHS repeats